MNKKYEFVPSDEITIAPGRTVKRIRALVAISVLGVTPGTLGGYRIWRRCPAMRGCTAIPALRVRVT